ncbi:MAG: hypothetical protein GXY05_09075 [Clostridiales bacterium]|nr:hypothetical protein [Clostridiales bacterium]
MRKLIALILVIILALTSASCQVGTSTDADESAGASGSVSPSPETTESTPQESTGVDHNVIMLKGTIGDLPVHMSLVIADGVVTGSYYYDKVGKELKLEGSTEAERMISFSEYDENGERTGSFDGWYTRGIRITGNWTNAKTGDVLEFNLNVIGGVPANAIWAGEWRRTHAGRFESAKLAIFSETSGSFRFQLDVFSGAHTGFIDGEATIDGKTALFKADETKAELKFSLNNGLIEIVSGGDIGYFGGMGVVFDGEYTQKALPEDTLLTQGYVSGAAEDQAFREMTGEDYVLFLNTAHLGYEEEDLDGFGAKVWRWRVRGLSGYNESIVMFLPDGALCTAVLDPENEVIKAYTNAGDIKNPPATILAWVADIQEALGLTADLPVKFHNAEKN